MALLMAKNNMYLWLNASSRVNDIDGVRSSNSMKPRWHFVWYCSCLFMFDILLDIYAWYTVYANGGQNLYSIKVQVLYVNRFDHGTYFSRTISNRVFL